VIGQDQSGQHLYEFSPSGTSYEYYAMSIGARSQSAKTYLEKNYKEFPKCKQIEYLCSPNDAQLGFIGNLEELIHHGLCALRETLQQDKELTIHNTSIGIIGPAGAHEKFVSSEGSFRIMEGEPVEVYLKSLTPKPDPTAAVPAETVGGDIQMQD
jgi:20S proteasome subunit alpha 6